ncbi:hypothetical protein Ddc_17880 [Ditylenchus destructor]|nr:hypothetical protein Ddc_17880 [Ditylenchus destructor]
MPETSHRPALQVSVSVEKRHCKRRLPETNAAAILGQLEKLRLKKLSLKKWSAFRREPWKSSPEKRPRGRPKKQGPTRQWTGPTADLPFSSGGSVVSKVTKENLGVLIV